MSAKNRGTVSIPGDRYPTPPWAVERLLEAAEPVPDGNWLEPACGTGLLARSISKFYRSKRDRINWTLLDVNPYHHLPGEILVGDFLEWWSPGQPAFDVAITNPPFSLAFEFARKMTSIARHSFLLTRLNILEAGKKSGRLKWLGANTPDVYVLPDRPCFSHTLECETCGATAPIAWDAPTPSDWAHHCRHTTQFHRRAGTDATGYCWLHWDSSLLPRSSGLITHLAETPKSERVDRVVER